jgi:RNA polymerase sigma factor (sigma-70 family)
MCVTPHHLKSLNHNRLREMKKRAKAASFDDYTQQTDREIVAACLEGDSAAWEVLIGRYQRLIYSIPLKTGLNSDDAADIFQSVCVKLLEKLQTLRDHEKLSSWLITTTTRESWRVSALRRRTNSIDSHGDDEGQDPAGYIAAAGPLADEEREALEQQQIVRDAVAALAERCRDLISMLFYQKDELSYADIARRMKMPVASIGPTRARCLEKLKKLLDGRL